MAAAAASGPQTTPGTPPPPAVTCYATWTTPRRLPSKGSSSATLPLRRRLAAGVLRRGQRLRSLGRPRCRRRRRPARLALDRVLRRLLPVLPPLPLARGLPIGRQRRDRRRRPRAAGDLPQLIFAPEQFIFRQALVADLRALRDTASWVLVNTFDELERPAIEALRVHLPAVTPVGPLFDPETNHGGGDGCTAWLDAWPPGSVVFVAFGSLVKLSRDETAELAAGLAATGRPFLLVARDNNDRWDLLPDVDGRGKVVAWCEQGRVLTHRAVGCFVTHCGWNSAVEALASGVPVVTFPGWADQPTNARFLEDVYGVGVRLPRPMARDAVTRCVEEVMSGPEAGAMRARAAEWKAAAGAAVAAGGSSDRGIQSFVNAVLSLNGTGTGLGAWARMKDKGLGLKLVS
ncbi:unnamed protein product [Urochloa humidicola]